MEIQNIPYDKKRCCIVMSGGGNIIMFKTTLKEYAIKEKQKISAEEVEKIAKEGEEHIAFTTAIDSLSRGIKSQNEIKKMLKTKKFSNEAIDSAVEKLLGYNYLGDKEYAEAFVSYKGEKFGRRKMIYELTAVKGIDRSIAENIVYERYDDDSEIEKGMRIASKYIDKEKKKRIKLKEKTYGFLALRGFDPEIIRCIIDRLDFSDGQNVNF